jgi:RND family efflux transporter MFP subunit
LQTRAAVINAREATAKSRHSNVSRLQELVAFKRIVAPFDGVVTRRRAEVGMLVTTGKESLFVVEDMSRVRVQANVPQAYSSQTRRGVSTTVSVPESAVPAVAGTVTRIADSVDSASRTMLAEVELDNASGRFQPGSYAQLALNLPQSDTSWTIPTNTVQMRVEGPHVALVDDRGQVEVRRVTLGRDLGSRVVVVGIRGDERLIVNPADDLVSGAQVEYSDPELAPRIAQR